MAHPRDPIVQPPAPTPVVPPPRHVHSLVVIGLALMVIGLISLTEGLLPTGMRMSFLIAAGLLFLVWGAVVRSAGPIIAGGILSGIGAGVVLAEQVFTGANRAGVIALVIGLGFLLIFPLTAFFTSSPQWWALIPGGILTIVGAVRLLSGVSLDVFDLLLVFVGGYLIWEVYRRPRAEKPHQE
jgi:hypothetical protein